MPKMQYAKYKKKYYYRPFEPNTRRDYKIGLVFYMKTHSVESSIII